MNTKQSAALESYLAQLLDPSAAETTEQAGVANARSVDVDDSIQPKAAKSAQATINVEKNKASHSTITSASMSQVEPTAAAIPSLKLPDKHPETSAPEPAALNSPVLKSHLERLLSRVSETTAAPAQVEFAATKTLAADEPVATATTAPVVQTPTMEDIVNSQQPILPLTSIEEFRAQLPGNFQTLIFYVGKLQLAMPLHLLGGIVKKEDEPTPIFGSPPWFTGLLQTNTGSLQVIDTGMYLFNERYTPDLKDSYQYIIRIGDSPWGLLVSELCTTKVLAHEEIRWFPNDNGRPWIAGIVKEEKCALLNAPALVARFQNESQKKPAKVKKPTMLDKKSAPKSGAVARRHRSDDPQNH